MYNRFHVPLMLRRDEGCVDAERCNNKTVLVVMSFVWKGEVDKILLDQYSNRNFAIYPMSRSVQACN